MSQVKICCCSIRNESVAATATVRRLCRCDRFIRCRRFSTRRFAGRLLPFEIYRCRFLWSLAAGGGDGGSRRRRIHHRIEWNRYFRCVDAAVERRGWRIHFFLPSRCRTLDIAVHCQCAIYFVDVVELGHLLRFVFGRLSRINSLRCVVCCSSFAPLFLSTKIVRFFAHEKWSRFLWAMRLSTIVCFSSIFTLLAMVWWNSQWFFAVRKMNWNFVLFISFNKESVKWIKCYFQNENWNGFALNFNRNQNIKRKRHFSIGHTVKQLIGECVLLQRQANWNSLNAPELEFWHLAFRVHGVWMGAFNAVHTNRSSANSNAKIPLRWIGVFCRLQLECVIIFHEVNGNQLEECDWSLDAERTKIQGIPVSEENNINCSAANRIALSIAAGIFDIFNLNESFWFSSSTKTK